jgi:uncharacterized membrane protein
LVISLLLLLPVGILVWWKDPISAVPMLTMTVILGSLLGYFIEKKVRSIWQDKCNKLLCSVNPYFVLFLESIVVGP